MSELDDHSGHDKAMQDEVIPMDGADPEYMHLETGTPQAEFDEMWRAGDTITPDGFIAGGGS